MSRRPPVGSGPIWVGLLDLDGDGPVTGVIGPPRADHRQARVLVRMHRAPIGLVWVPTLPEQTLTEQARAVAESALDGPLRRHAELDQESGGPGGPDGGDGWERRMACPARFAAGSGEGISVLVPTRNRPTLLAGSLRSLQRIDYHRMEILVIDNAPDGDATRQVVAALAADDPRVRYTCQPRPGRSVALNHGLEQAKFEIVAMTDDDTLADPGWLSAVAAAFEADPATVCVTGMVASSALDNAAERYFDARYDWGTNFHPRRYDLTEHRHPSPFYPFRAGLFGTGANCAVLRQALTRIGGFDPLLGAGTPGRGGDDLDMFLRLVLAGGRISYLPSALVWHQHRADLQALSEQVYSYGHGLGAYLAKHLAKHGLRAALRGHGFGESRSALARVQAASEFSHLGMAARRLALTEMRGLMTGVVRYRLAALARRRAATPGK